MNYDQFATSFRNPEKVANQEGRVVLSGTVVTATDESCCIEINGAQYEIPSSDVIDIRVLSPLASSGEKAVDTESQDQVAKALAESQGPVAALITLDRNAVLCRRIPAALLAATGTWMAVVPAAKAA